VIRQTRFDGLVLSTYSREREPSATKMERQIPERVNRRRRDLAVAEQLKVARQVAESFVGRTIDVLVEKQAAGKELSGVFSWEHGLIGEAAPRHSHRGIRHFLVAPGRPDAPDRHGRVDVRAKLTAAD